MIEWAYTLIGGTGSGSASDSSGSTGSDNASIGLQIADLALDPVSGDLAFPPRIIRGAEAVAQRIRVRFRWFLGEWFLDQRQGVPYYRDILVKNPDPILISFIFRRVLTSTPGVRSVSKFSAVLDRASRTLTVNFEATLADSSTLIANAEPFILDG